MLATLLEAANYIHKEKNNDEVIYNQLLLNSKEFLHGIKKVISENQKDTANHKVFNQIKICEKKVVELLIQNKVDRIHELTGELREDIKDLIVIFEKEISVTYHIVFFAELGQKWDAMQSVYEAFNKRIDCEVSVVLTPIFRSIENEEGKIETDVIYEDYLTPLGIKNIPYEDYDLSKEQPDMAFISNPYESVTLPQFWPENIAKYTKLVYLPYYTEMIINDVTIQANCKLPVAKCAWRIISQSEKAKSMHEKYSVMKGKNVLVTGLPKWDGMFDSVIPSNESNEEWKRKLIGKKVFLWNSHYNINSQTSTFLEYGRHIINLFSTKEDIALIWRPHPMMGTIFKLYLPEYASYWEECKGTVENSRNMILDTNISYDMAFEYSDALISDYSSIIAQYLFTQKPILVLQKGNGAVADSEEVVQTICLEQAYSHLDIERFIKNIKNDIDPNLSQRVRIIDEDLPYADGKIGERICNLLLSEFQNSF
ncbi:CDP-glycerol glycerophosphotransferase family protein [Sporosarcina sp. FSL W8-0480]|uniref:CDP-glycerol glycerophosphotransferase family protein n=1 Tax=Sporosarcina sp. FSL W8-0480 TaxID=2954701 RepID=UPI0030DD172A